MSGRNKVRNKYQKLMNDGVARAALIAAAATAQEKRANASQPETAQTAIYPDFSGSVAEICGKVANGCPVDTSYLKEVANGCAIVLDPQCPQEGALAMYVDWGLHS